MDKVETDLSFNLSVYLVNRYGYNQHINFPWLLSQNGPSDQEKYRTNGKAPPGSLT